MRFRSRSSLIALAAIVSLVACRVERSAQAADADSAAVDAPAPVPLWLAQGAQYEAVTTNGANVDRALTFTNARAASGITFVDSIVDDAAKAYKPVHYDHGSGLAAADVDGDGRPDLFFVSQRGSSALWRNLGNGKFEDFTDRAGLRMRDAIAVGAAFADVDNDGDPDLFVTTVRHGNRLFENLGGGKFRDVTQAAGVGYVGHSSGAVFFDYDGDGRLDLFVANVGTYTSDSLGAGGYYVGLKDAFHGHTHAERAEASLLYHNEGGLRFRDVTKASGLVDMSWSGDATPIDANDDGRPDLYVLDMQGQNHLWLNVGPSHDSGARFVDATATYFPRTPWGAMGAAVLDANGDGALDLYVTDMHSDMFAEVPPGEWMLEAQKSDPRHIPPDFLPNGASTLVFGNALFERARRGAAFDEVSQRVGGETYWPWGPSVGDVNADGWDDVFVTGGMGFPFRYGTNTLFLNDAGHLVRSEFASGIEPRRGALWRDWFAVDCGGADAGHPSCEVCRHEGAEGCKGDPSGRLTVQGVASSRSAVILDLDGDGDLDIVTNDFGGPPQVLVSDLAQKRTVHWLGVRLRGTTSNRQALGAVVTAVLPDGRRVTKVLDGNSGYLSRSDLPLYFGFGAADHATSIEVRWPSGARQTVAGPIAAGKVMEISESP